MEKVIARRGTVFLVQTSPTAGRVLDHHGLSGELPLDSLLARGYWERAELSLAEAQRIVREES